MLFLGSLLSPAVQAQLSSVIGDRFLTLDIQVFVSHLVGKLKQVRAAEKGA